MRTGGARRLVALLMFVAGIHAVAAQAPAVTYKPMGLGFGPWMDGQNPELRAVVGEAQVRERLAIVAPYTRWIRAYGSTHGLELVAPVAREFGLQVACAAWLGEDLPANAEEIAAVILAANRGYCDMVVVGSEVLHRPEQLSEAQLLAYMGTVQAAVTDVPVATAEIYSDLLTHPAVIAAADLLLVHYYPFWERVTLKHAVASVYRSHARVVAAAGGKPVWIGESGWPSCGPKQGDAVPNAKNAAKYFLNLVSWARAGDVPLFYFAALDESWKTASEGPSGACWGVFDRLGAMKPGMQKVFAGKRVAAFIRVAGLWWTKPTFAAPATEIWPDGTWVTDITTGGTDPQATDIAAYLLPAAFAPPLVGGAPVLPASLEQNAVASTEAARTP